MNDSDYSFEGENVPQVENNVKESPSSVVDLDNESSDSEFALTVRHLHFFLFPNLSPNFAAHKSEQGRLKNCVKKDDARQKSRQSDKDN